MGYPVPVNTPTFAVGAQTYCIAAFDFPNPMGTFYQIGVYIRMNDGSWTLAVLNGADGMVATYPNAGDVLADMQAKGGRVAYLKWLLDKINAVLAKLFKGAAPVPGGEPTTDQQAKDIINAYVLGLKVTVVNGIPVAS